MTVLKTGDDLMKPSKVFLVGGAVRDGLLGLPVKDKDFCVIGTTVDAMITAGFKPVGKDFPVFLHPKTNEEYALARTERKNGTGYKGFVVFADENVTLEDDLARRDLTINAMAMSENGEIIDPFDGKSDLKNKLLRHVRAETFVEDPVRVLRLARFYARYSEFTVCDETFELVKSIVAKGELAHLVPERVWQELVKGLMEDQPQRMFEFLHECGALKVLMPELDTLWGIDQPLAHHPEKCTAKHVMLVLQQAAIQKSSMEVRFAALLHDLGKGLTPAHILPSHHGHEEAGVALVEAVCKRIKATSACRDLAVMACREHTRVHVSLTMKKSSIVQLFERTDALRRPDRFFQLLQACECDAKGRLGFENRSYPQMAHLKESLQIVKGVDAGFIASQCDRPHLIPVRIYEERVRSLKAMTTEVNAENQEMA